MSTLQRSIARPGYAALVGAIVLALAWPAGVEAMRFWPLLASLLLLGLSHGAVDHHVPARLGVAGHRGLFLLAYVGLALAGIVAWFVAPGAALALFLLVAVLHWGTADVWFARNVSGRAPFGRPWRAAAFIAARGLVPVLLPLLIFPAAAAEGTGAILHAVGAGGEGWAPAGGWRDGGFVLVGAAVLLAVLAAWLDHRGSDRRGAARIDVGEVALLTLTMLVVTPVFAVGVYFVAWHAARHVGRLMATSPDQARRLDDGRPGAALLAWHGEAAPLTIVSLAGLALLVLLAWRLPAAGDALTGGALAMIAALTLPHAVVVAWMDKVQLAGVWRAQPDDSERRAGGPSVADPQTDRPATSSLRGPGTIARPAVAP